MSLVIFIVFPISGLHIHILTLLLSKDTLEKKHKNQVLCKEVQDRQKTLVPTVQVRNPRIGKFKELAQSHRLWKYELYSVVYMNIIKNRIFHTY